MNKKIIAIIGAISLLSACETASQKVVSGSSASGSGSASSSSKSLFASAKQTKADKLIAVGDRVLFDYCLLYTSPSPRDRQKSRMPSSA